MRPGVLVSAVGHVGAVLMTLIAWPQNATPHAQAGDVVPVEIVNIGEVSNVRALTAALEEENNAPSQADASAQQQEQAAEPAPSPTARPPRQETELDLNTLGALLADKQRPQRNQQIANASRSDRSRRGVGAGTAETARLTDYIRARTDAHIGSNRCWRAPVDSPDPERLRVVVQIDLDRTAHIRGQPRVLSPAGIVVDPVTRAAVNNALYAARACDPYPFADDPVTADHYEAWRRITLNLDPTNVHGH